IQHFHDCPNSPTLIKRVNEALKGLDNIDYKEILVDTNEIAEEVKFRGSPTLLINGKDFENMPEPEKPALMCRYYPNGLPNINDIRERILK
ncbi:MAG: DUF2703 domain-containing protein, partial [Ignavibacteriaceae bacterium]